jgi:restriction system protein
MSNRIPDFQTLMLPFLQHIADGQPHSIQQIYEKLCDQYQLTKEEKEAMLPSGNQAIMKNRVGWTRTYLKKAGLIASPQRGSFLLTEEGKNVLSQKPQRIDVKFLKSLSPEFKEWQTSNGSRDETEVISAVEKTEVDSGKTPEELLEYSFTQMRTELALELLDKVKSSSPSFFEILVIDLLIKMGYGGSRKEAGQVMGKSGDGGIDGLIKEDKLGLDTIYVQAKKWENTVTIHQVRDFAGSLLAKKARKGILITTSGFPASAFEFIGNIDPRIRLIDGKELAELMVEYNVGVAVKKNYEVKRLDTDYFEEI